MHSLRSPEITPEIFTVTSRLYFLLVEQLSGCPAKVVPTLENPVGRKVIEVIPLSDVKIVLSTL